MQTSMTYSRVLRSYVKCEQKCKRAIKSADDCLVYLQKELDLMHQLQEEVDYFLEAPLVPQEKADEIIHHTNIALGNHNPKSNCLNRSRIDDNNQEKLKTTFVQQQQPTALRSNNAPKREQNKENRQLKRRDTHYTDDTLAASIKSIKTIRK